MTGVSQERIKTARLIGSHLATRDGRQLLGRNGYESGAPIIASEWETPVEDVMGELRSASKAKQAVVAIRRGDRLYWMSVTPTTPAEAKDKVSGASTIGMLYQAVAQSVSPWAVRVTSMSQARVLLPQ